MKEFPKLLHDRQMAGAAIDAAVHQARPKLIKDRQAFRGMLYGYQTDGKGLIRAQVGRTA